MEYAIHEIYDLLSKGTWNKSDREQVSPEPLPSYVCSLFSELAYYHIPQWEIDDRKRVKLIPCRAYQTLAAAGRRTRAPNIDSRRFVIEDRGTIVLGNLLNRNLFIAYRGTQFLFDWKVNSRARLVPLPARGWHEEWGCGQVHSGFLEEAIRVSARILYEIRDYDFEHVFLTGHSLGGAVAALSETFLRRRLGSDASIYIFGAPKYCDISEYAARLFGHIPTQFRRSGDLVPTVPPVSGYADHPYEFGTDCAPYIDSNLYPEALKEVLAFNAFRSWGKFWASQFERHSIEGYRTDLGIRLGAVGAKLPLAPVEKLTYEDVER